MLLSFLTAVGGGYLTIHHQRPVRQNCRSESASAFQCCFSTLNERAVHPIARPAFFNSEKPDSLDLELLSDQLIEPLAAGNDVSSEHFRAAIPDGEPPAEIFVNFLLEKGDLAFVITSVIEIAIPLNPPPGQTANL